jgi:Flp pilus assembly protein TadD
MVERNERVEEALKMIQRAVKAEPQNAAYVDSLGWTYFRLGKFEEAERHLNEALQIASSSSTTHEHLGDVLDGQGKLEAARKSWAQALRYSTSSEQSARIRLKMSGESKR